MGVELRRVMAMIEKQQTRIAAAQQLSIQVLIVRQLTGYAIVAQPIPRAGALKVVVQEAGWDTLSRLS